MVADPELRYTASGIAVANFAVAYTPRFFDRPSRTWKDGDAVFLRARLWRHPAETAAETLRMGMRVILCGRLRQRSFGTGTGEKRTLTEVEVEEIGLSLRYATAARRLCRPGNSNQNPARSILESDEPAPSPNWELGRTGGWCAVSRVKRVGSSGVRSCRCWARTPLRTPSMVVLWCPGGAAGHAVRLGGRQFRRGPCMHSVPQDLPERVEVGVQQGAGLLPKILWVRQLGQATP